MTHLILEHVVEGTPPQGGDQALVVAHLCHHVTPLLDERGLPHLSVRGGSRLTEAELTCEAPDLELGQGLAEDAFTLARQALQV